MTAESSKVAVLEEAYRQWHESKGASVGHWMDLMTDDISFRSLAAGAAPVQFTQASTNKSQVQGYFSGLTAEWEMIYYRVDEYIAQNDRVVALCEVSFRHKKTGKVATSPKADFHRFRAGKICEFFEFYDTAGLKEAAMP